MTLYIAGEDIKAGRAVICGPDGKLYAPGSVNGTMVAVAEENIREGLRVAIKFGQAREDDA